MNTQPVTLGELVRLFDTWLQREGSCGRRRPRTLDYYRHQLQPFVAHVGAGRLVQELQPLELWKTGWHSVQAVQRLFNWGQDMLNLPINPLRRIVKPALGRRDRVLQRGELARLLRVLRSEGRLRPGQRDVFVNARGRPWKQNALCLRMQRLCRRAGLEKGLVRYQPRRSFGTGLARTKANAATIAELMGHTDFRTSLHRIHLAGEVSHLRAARQVAFPR